MVTAILALIVALIGGAVTTLAGWGGGLDGLRRSPLPRTIDAEPNYILAPRGTERFSGQLLFQQEGRTNAVQNFELQANGAKLRRIAVEDSESQVTLSPGGRWTASVRRLGSGYAVFLASSRGGPAKPISKGFIESVQPAWSPDGRHIAFAGQQPGEATHDIYVYNIDGNGMDRITSDRRDSLAPSWSPDGRQLVFQSRNEGRFTIQLANVNSRSIKDLTTDAEGNSLEPSWSPNGQEIAFVSDRDGIYGIYLMRPDGSSQRRLPRVNREGHEYAPAWSPDGRFLAFVERTAGRSRIFVTGQEEDLLVRMVQVPGFITWLSWDARR